MINNPDVSVIDEIIELLSHALAKLDEINLGRIAICVDEALARALAQREAFGFSGLATSA